MKTIKTYIDLPLEEGKTYKTKFQTGDTFTVVKIFKDKKTSEIYRVEGIYENAKHLGICPLDVNRILPDKVEGPSETVCEHCNNKIT